MKAKEILFEVRTQIKEQICNILVDRYKELHNGELPNWEDDEEIVLTKDEIDEKDVNYLHIEEYNTYDEYYNVVKYAINRYIVTLDYNLFFEVGDCEEQYDWQEVYLEELADLLDYLKEKFNN